MNAKMILLMVSLLLGAGSLIMPYQVREYTSYVTPTAPSQSNTTTTTAPLVPQIEKDYENGIRMIVPLFSLPVLILIFVLLGFARSRSTAIISLVFACLDILWMPVILFAIHFNLFSSNTYHTGIGYYMLCAAVLIQFVLPIMILKQKDYLIQPKQKHAGDLLDDL